MQRSKRGLREEILDHEFWYHRIDLGDGFYTPGFVGAEKYLELALPQDLSGKSVLDIGSYNGLFAFEAERRGADRVVATDLWEGDERTDALEQGHRRAGFERARDYLDSDVEAQSINLLDISPETVGTFDIVLCPGVIYRLKTPMVGVENLVSVTRERAVVTCMRPLSPDPETPAMEFYEHGERLNDPTIWWMPTQAGIGGMMRAAGCRQVRTFPVPDVSDDSVPPTEPGFIPDAPVEIYRDHRLTKKVDEIVPDLVGRSAPDQRQGPPYRVNVLYRTDDAVRIMYSSETPEGSVERRQAWIDCSDISAGSGGSGLQETLEGTVSLLESAVSISRSEGIRNLTKRALERFRYGYSPTEFVSHGYV